MKLPELINYLIAPNKLDELYRNAKVDNNSEALLIYMKGALHLESEVNIFEIENTEDDLVYSNDGIIYYQLFPVDHAVDLIESDLELKDRGYTNEYIAQRLLGYRLNDA